ncbi:MAG: pilus assembly PilX N-terminal domain-containing protein [bacterium]|nr:pilus assembly PilX N-terminal domain-containing protein [bacterium]
MRKSQHGFIALSFTLLAVLVLSGIGVSALVLTSSQQRLVRNTQQSLQAYYGAEAGVEEALLRFMDPERDLPATYALLVGGNIVEIAHTTGVFNVQYFESSGNAKDRIRTARAALGLDPEGTTFAFAAHIGELGLEMESNATVNGNVYSNGNITGGSNTEINGDASAVGTISSPDPDISGTAEEGASLIPLPPFDSAGWAQDANINADPIIGNLVLESGTTELGPRKIQGDLIMDGNAELVVTGPLHVTGDFVMNSNSEVYLEESFGSDGTAIFVEGVVQFKSNAEVHATNADPKGYLLIASTSPSEEAVLVDSNSELEAAIYAVNGNVVMNSNGEVVALIGNGVILKSNAEINFDLGLIVYTFTSGGTGGYKLIEWKEVE